MAKVRTQKKHFRLPGNNRKIATPPPPAPIQLTLANASLWQAKFMEEIRNEFRILNAQIKEALANAGTE